MKYIHKFVFIDPFDLPAMESWLEEMAGQGLHFAGSGPLTARFLPGEPRTIRYRLEPAQAAADPERAAYYAEKGWTLSGRFGSLFAVFTADDPGVGELHTDPVAQGYALAALDRSLKQSTLFLAFCLLLMAGMIGSIYVLSPWPWLTAIEGGAVSQLLLIAVEFMAAGNYLWMVRGLRRLRRQLLSGIPMEHNKDYRRSNLPKHLFNAFSLLLGLFAIGLSVRTMRDQWQKPLSEVQGEIPFLSLETLEQAADYQPVVSIHWGEDFNHRASYQWSPLADHYESGQRGTIPSRIEEDGEAYTCDLSMDYFDLAFPALASPVLDDLVYRYTEYNYFPEEYTVEELSWPGLDRAVVALDQDFPGCRVFVSLGDRVVYLDYSGTLSADALLNAAAALLAG